MNVKKLLAVKEAILASPHGADMREWCGTCQCIGGWALQLEYNDDNVVSRLEGSDFKAYFGLKVAADILGLSSWQKSSLFYLRYWDVKYQAKYDAVLGDKYEQARVVAEYIDYFIAKHTSPVECANPDTSEE